MIIFSFDFARSWRPRCARDGIDEIRFLTQGGAERRFSSTGGSRYDEEDTSAVEMERGRRIHRDGSDGRDKKSNGWRVTSGGF